MMEKKNQKRRRKKGEKKNGDRGILGLSFGS